jgi:DNA replication licensing factor MCM7
MYITPRTLLGIIRISQAMAKFNFRNVVEQPDVDQAIKLMDYSLRTLDEISSIKQGQGRRRKYTIFTNITLIL